MLANSPASPFFLPLARHSSAPSRCLTSLKATPTLIQSPRIEDDEDFYPDDVCDSRESLSKCAHQSNLCNSKSFNNHSGNSNIMANNRKSNLINLGTISNLAEIKSANRESNVFANNRLIDANIVKRSFTTEPASNKNSSRFSNLSISVGQTRNDFLGNNPNQRLLNPSLIKSRPPLPENKKNNDKNQDKNNDKNFERNQDKSAKSTFENTYPPKNNQMSKSFNPELFELKKKLKKLDAEATQEICEAEKKFKYEFEQMIQNHKIELENHGFHLPNPSSITNELTLTRFEGKRIIIAKPIKEKSQNNENSDDFGLSDDQKKKKQKILQRQKREIVEITIRWTNTIEKLKEDSQIRLAPIQNKICSLTNELELNDSIMLYIPTGSHTPDSRYCSPFISFNTFKRRTSDGTLTNCRRPTLKLIQHE
ncbi:hypothetical protein TRFO_11651 [Tritrichomonas foetus]|uniref:Uncharacterized protein n=1 Tax=Tritrichomonas foetus TaxID=1144522 RepID=A0A1J4J7L9_9EUKA|nr:hypothetical protein TRFO_11651 [Tritrichomonas foetus]|eukprot:OHS93651.1 hypothetical protein TRFO_11651 [Tritrichomonas foetus]